MEKAIFWHRRDLRINDNAGLFKALSAGFTVQPIFIFDETILSKLKPSDQRVLFIHQQLEIIKKQYQAAGSDLLVFVGDPVQLIPQIAKELNCRAVFTNRDYEPYALTRDKSIFDQLQKLSIEFIGKKDHVIFEKNEVLKNDGLPYTVFTPYSRKWKERAIEHPITCYPSEELTAHLVQTTTPSKLVSLKELGFDSEQLVTFPASEAITSIINNYEATRDIPAINGTSKLSVHLRFGTISIRSLALKAQQTNEKFLNELIWRDFYQMIIFHFPHSVERSFRSDYDRIVWENNMDHFAAWCVGKTGYPLVDAGMRELNETGHMHNRVRMVVASFLTKHLLLDWRLGERYFAEKLLDFELASNIGGWQWAAGSGCDAAPYFRVFNPTSQQEKFDPKFTYIKKWIPEFGTAAYPQPIVEHKWARERVLARYKEALKP